MVLSSFFLLVLEGREGMPTISHEPISQATYPARGAFLKYKDECFFNLVSRILGRLDGGQDLSVVFSEWIQRYGTQALKTKKCYIN